VVLRTAQRHLSADGPFRRAVGGDKFNLGTERRSCRRVGRQDPIGNIQSVTPFGVTTRLTQQTRRDAKGAPPPAPELPPAPPRVCRSCGDTIVRGQRCQKCGWTGATERRITARPPAGVKRQAVIGRRIANVEAAWESSDLPSWLTGLVYRDRIQPCLNRLSPARLAAALGVSNQEAIAIREGRNRPHPRHWIALASLVGIEKDDSAD
jgi:hypothetical protein